MMLNMTRLVLFDIDCTLITSGGAGRVALTQAMEEHFGLKDPFAGVCFQGKTDPLIVRDVFTARGMSAPDDATVSAVLDRYVELLEGALRNLPYGLLPGVAELLEEATADTGVRLGLATGNIKRGAELKLRVGDLWRYFEFGGFSSDFADRRELTRFAVTQGRALSAEHIPDDQIVVVGDTPADVACAKFAGVRSVAVATGSHSQSELLRGSPDLLLPSLAGIGVDQLFCR